MLAFARWTLAASLASAIALGTAHPTKAQFATPEAVLQSLYALYRSKEGPGLPSDRAGVRRFLEPGLAGAWLRDAAKASAGKNVIDFDPFIDGQDWDISDLKIVAGQITGERATVPVRFRNFGQPRSLVYRLARGPDGWRIYDVTSRAGRGLRRNLSLQD